MEFTTFLETVPQHVEKPVEDAADYAAHRNQLARPPVWLPGDPPQMPTCSPTFITWATGI
jgi:hypothetical protein